MEYILKFSNLIDMNYSVVNIMNEAFGIIIDELAFAYRLSTQWRFVFTQSTQIRGLKYTNRGVFGKFTVSAEV